MSKTVINVSMFAALVLSLFTRIAFADIAPDPIYRRPSFLVIALIVCAVIATIIILVKFLKK